MPKEAERPHPLGAFHYVERREVLNTVRNLVPGGTRP